MNGITDPRLTTSVNALNIVNTHKKSKLSYGVLMSADSKDDSNNENMDSLMYIFRYIKYLKSFSEIFKYLQRCCWNPLNKVIINAKRVEIKAPNQVPTIHINRVITSGFLIYSTGYTMLGFAAINAY